MVYRAVIPPAYEDRNGHMNVRWYLVLYDEAGDAMYPMLGLTAEYFAASGMGGFDLEHHLWYAAEVHIGDTVVIRAAHPRAELEADPLPDVHGERDPGRALLDLRVRARARRPHRPSHRPLPGAGGGSDRRLHRRTPCAALARAGLGVHGEYKRSIKAKSRAPIKVADNPRRMLPTLIRFGYNRPSGCSAAKGS